MSAGTPCLREGGHDYQPRYDEAPPTRMPDLFFVSDGSKAKIIESLKTKTYVCDICARCGHVIARTK